MKGFSLTAGCVLSALAACLLAQTPAPVASGRPNNIRPGIAMVSGENPVIRLFDKEGGKILKAEKLIPAKARG